MDRTPYTFSRSDSCDDLFQKLERLKNTTENNMGIDDEGKNDAIMDIEQLLHEKGCI